LAGDCRNRNNEKPGCGFRRLSGVIYKSRHCIGGFAFLRTGVSLLNGDGQLALQSGFFVSLLRHLSHPQFKSFSTALDAGNSRNLRDQKKLKKA